MQEVFKLKKPIKIDGVEVKELTYDFDELSIADLEAIERMVKKQVDTGSDVVNLIEFSMPHHLSAFVQAVIKCNPNYMAADIRRIKGKDATKAAALGRAFFMNSLATESDDAETSPDSCETTP